MNQHYEIIKKGSKSFFLASLFFSKKERNATWMFYSWCRYCDDAIDGEKDHALQKQKLSELQSKTAMLMSNPEENDSNFLALEKIVREYDIPLQYLLDFLRGMEMDVLGKRYYTLKELEEYCYCVAGTVGLMMCHILGVRADLALPHAVALGMAMQLTNMARDIHEDKILGRLYIPLHWLDSIGLREADLFNDGNKSQLIFLQEKLLRRADELYKEGYEGLKYLSLRSSWAVLIASQVYSNIGQVIRNNPTESLKKRAIVPITRKVFLVLKSLVLMFPIFFKTLTLKKTSAPKEVWSFSL